MFRYLVLLHGPNGYTHVWDSFHTYKKALQAAAIARKLQNPTSRYTRVSIYKRLT